MNLRIGLHFPRSELLSVLEIRLDFALATLNQIMTVDQVERKGKKMKLYLRYHYCCFYSHVYIGCSNELHFHFQVLPVYYNCYQKKGNFVDENFKRSCLLFRFITFIYLVLMYCKLF